MYKFYTQEEYQQKNNNKKLKFSTQEQYQQKNDSKKYKFYTQDEYQNKIKEPSTQGGSSAVKNIKFESPLDKKPVYNFTKTPEDQGYKFVNNKLTSLSLKEKEDIEYNKKNDTLKTVIGEKAYNDLGESNRKFIIGKGKKQFAYVPGQAAWEDWEKKYPDAADKLNKYILSNRNYNKAESAAVGAFDSASLGMLDKLSKGYDEDSPFKKAKQQNPGAYTVGTIGGYLVPGSGVSKGANALLRPVLNKVGSKVAQRAIEGSVGNAAMEFAEGNIRGESAPQIAKRTALGFAFGGAGNVAAYGLGKAGKVIIDKIKAGKQLTAAEKEIVKNNPEIYKNNVAEQPTINSKSNANTITMANRKTDLNGNLKERSFPQNVQTSKDTPASVSNELKSNPLEYEVLPNQKTMERVKRKVDADPEQAYNDFLTGTGKRLSADDVATGELFIKKAFDSGNDKQAYYLISHLAERLTEAGQAIQAASLFKRMTPEGMLMYAERVISKANRELETPATKGGIADPFKKYYKKGQLTDEMKDRIKNAMSEATNLPDGREKTVKMAEVMQTIAEAMPTSPGEKLESLRTITMLSNPKTWVRNFVGNAAFGAVESAVTKPISTLTDKLLNLKTGQRTVLNTNWKETAKGFAKGTSNAIDDFKRGIDTSPTRGQFELPRKNEFKNIPIINKLERVVKLGVSGGDRPFYEAAYKDALEEQMKLYKINTGKQLTDATTEMKQAAEEVARYRTYADDNMISNALQSVKRGMNRLRIGGVGAGDVLMKFTRTPANLLARGIDYSPAGLIKGMVDIGRVMAGNTELQRKASEGFARGVVGTGFVTAAIALSNLGIIKGQQGSSTTANALEKATGRNQYSINFSALSRLISSKFNPEAAKPQPNDQIATYDWAQPLALSTSVGANISSDLKKNKKLDAKSVIGIVVNSLESGVNTMVEQPMLQSISRVFKGDNPVQGLLSVVQSYPASFVPAFLQGMRYAIDPNIRDVSGGFAESAINMVKNRIPGASKTLPKSIDVLGNERKVSGKSPVRRMIDANLNPAIVTSLKDDKVSEEIYRLYDRTKDGSILPNYVSPNETLPTTKKGELPKKFTPEQRSQYQKMLAEDFLPRVKQAMSGEYSVLVPKNDYYVYSDQQVEWDKLSDEEKIKILTSLRRKSDDAVKKKMQQIVYK